jgi:AGCS family alanine or glycine:cation symporter
MHEIVQIINGWIWGAPLIYLCLGAGLIFSLLTRFVQIRLFGEMLRLLFSSQESDRGISSFQALAVSLSGRVGTGNIAGVAAAIGFGGPGAIFWMWVVAFLGSATAYVESTLGQIYKEEDEGQYRGGPAFYIEKGMGQKWYAWIFAVATIVATGLLLPGVQSNAIGNAVELAVGGGGLVNSWFGELSLTKLIAAIALSSILGFIIFGGVKRIAHFTQFVVPIMAIGYIVTAVAIVGMNISALPDIFRLILKNAFTVQAFTGGAVFWGVKRGIFSNEAGQGTGPHAAAAAEVQHPAQQGLVQAFSVYIDTLFICTATALMILITKSYNVLDGLGLPLPGFHNVDASIDPNTPTFTQLAVDSAMPGIGTPFVAVALFFFAFTTLLAYYYIAETNVAYLRRYFRVPAELVILKILLIVSVFYGTIRTASLAWDLGEIGVGLMAWLNIVAILILFLMSKPAIKALRDYERQRKAGAKEYHFDPEELGIRNADFWQDDR